MCSEAYLAFKKIVTDRRFVKDLEMCSKFFHTGNLEVFHSLMLKYCTKRIHFSYLGMIARTQLAVLHFNEAIKCQIAVTKDGVPRNKVQYSKVSQSFVAKPIKNRPERKYLDDIMSFVIELAPQGKDAAVEFLPSLPNIPKFIAPGVKPEKGEVVRMKTSRFSCYS